MGLGFGLAASPNRAAWSHRTRAALQGTLHAHARRAAAASAAAGSAAAASAAARCASAGVLLGEDGGGQQHGHRPLGGAAALDGRPKHGRAVGRVEGARVACARRSEQVAARARGRGLHVEEVELGLGLGFGFGFGLGLGSSRAEVRAEDRLKEAVLL